MRGLTLEGLTLLDAIDRAGSFSGAGVQLHKATSTVSYAVGKLEQHLDVVLFERHGPRVALTPAGRELLQEGRLLLQAADELECRVRRVANGWETELRIGLDSLILPSMLESSLASFCSSGPPTRVKLMVEALTGTWEALLERRADLVLAVGDGPSGGGWRSLPVADLDFVFCAAPSHPLASGGRKLSDAQIQRHRAVVVSDSARHLPTRTVGLLRGQELLAVPDMRTKFAFQVAGLGVGFLPERCARPAIERGLLVERDVQTPKPAERIHLAWRPTDEGPAMQWWVRRLSEPGLVTRLLEHTARAWTQPR